MQSLEKGKCGDSIEEFCKCGHPKKANAVTQKRDFANAVNRKKFYNKGATASKVICSLLGRQVK